MTDDRCKGWAICAPAKPRLKVRKARAAITQYNVAVALARRGHFANAKEYALAALRNFQTYGEGAKDELMKTFKLIAMIDQGLKSKGGLEIGA